MEINLLGPLEVLRDGVVLTPTAPKLRNVLSLLVLQMNSVVRTERIIEELWEDDPPASVTTTLQTYIYQLRKLLRLAAPQGWPNARDVPEVAALRTSPCGYALSLEPNMLDAIRFERQFELGRRELDDGNPRQATETLSRALRLWRGSALVDVTQGPVLRAEALRLEELYKNALECRIEADLQLGRHHELLGELTRLAAQQPTHEGFQAKLMLALYRAGRRSEALQTYQRTRRTLATNLGLDPSGELEHLHSAVLAADQSLDLPRSRGTGHHGRTHPPRQLPPAGPALVGQQATVDAALHALSTRQHHAPPVVVVTGPPGSGKTALCAQIGHRTNASYPDGQLYARLLDDDGRMLDPTDVLAEFLRAVEVPDDRIPDNVCERSRMFRTWTAGRRVLVTLDDLVSIEQLLPLVPSSPECGVLVAARRQLSTPDVTASLAVRPLDVETALRLLTNVLGEHRISQDQAAARDLVRLCDGLPAALHATAGRLAVRPHWRIGKLVEWLRGQLAQPGVGEPSGTGPLYRSVRTTCRIMSPETRSGFRSLAALGFPTLSPPLAAELLGASESYAESLLEELAEYGLIEAEPDPESGLLRYRFLASVLAVGARLPPEPESGARAEADPRAEARAGAEPMAEAGADAGVEARAEAGADVGVDSAPPASPEVPPAVPAPSRSREAYLPIRPGPWPVVLNPPAL